MGDVLIRAILLYACLFSLAHLLLYVCAEYICQSINQITMRVLSPMWEVALVTSILQAETTYLYLMLLSILSIKVTAPSLLWSSSWAPSWNLSFIDLLGHSIVTHLLYLLLTVLLPLLHHIQHPLLLQSAPNIHIPHSIHSGNPLYPP